MASTEYVERAYPTLCRSKSVDVQFMWSEYSSYVPYLLTATLLQVR